MKLITLLYFISFKRGIEFKGICTKINPKHVDPRVYQGMKKTTTKFNLCMRQMEDEICRLSALSVIVQYLQSL